MKYSRTLSTGHHNTVLAENAEHAEKINKTLPRFQRFPQEKIKDGILSSYNNARSFRNGSGKTRFRCWCYHLQLLHLKQESKFDI